MARFSVGIKVLEIVDLISLDNAKRLEKTIFWVLVVGPVLGLDNIILP
jgi:hypothetical protein